MGNLSSINDDGDDGHVRSRAERWAMAKRCVALLQVGRPRSTALASAFFCFVFGNIAGCWLTLLIRLLQLTAPSAGAGSVLCCCCCFFSCFLSENRDPLSCFACVNRSPHTIHSPLPLACLWVAQPLPGACLNTMVRQRSPVAPQACLREGQATKNNEREQMPAHLTTKTSFFFAVEFLFFSLVFNELSDL